MNDLLGDDCMEDADCGNVYCPRHGEPPIEDDDDGFEEDFAGEER